MADPDSTQNVTAPLYNVSSGPDTSKMNVMGVGTDENITKAFEETLKAKQDLADSLEKRYARPNWFRIAAGFAKPQLGGFIASLGSANEALGEQVEAQRAIEPTVARMRAEVAAQNIPFQQRMKQKQLLEAWQQSGKPMDAATYQKIISYGKDSDIAQSASGYFEAAQKAQELRQTEAQFAIKNPLGVVQDYMNFSLSPPTAESGKKIEDLDNKLNAAVPRGIDPQQWQAMTRGDKIVAIANNAQEQAKANMSVEEQMRESAQAAPKRLATLSTIRDLALGTGIPETQTADGKTKTGQQQMADALNYFGSNNPIDAIARAAADGAILGGKLEGFDVYARQMGLSPEARDKFQLLVKLLAENQVALRGTSVNPTDQFTALQQIASPSIANSQRALVTLTDMMALSDQHNLRKYEFAKTKKVPYGYLDVDPEYQALEDEYRSKFRKIASSNPLMEAGPQYQVQNKDRNAASSSNKSTSGSAPINIKSIIDQYNRSRGGQQ